ncbi:5,6-dimethylbenzimidazole synthase [Pseudorhodoferax sp. Leaf274]|nr:5,6-dimethylbenzimidazole synthase [Pseudorhodoferax sp. Leaf274]
MTAPGGAPPAHFCAQDRAAVYGVLHARRDMRHFVPGQSVPDEVLERMLRAAHCAPSVGLMQPWRLIRVRDPALREGIALLVEQERLATAAAMQQRTDEFLALKVEGVRDCAELLVAVLAPDDGTLFGRRTMPRDMALCSAACAIQNLWLAARAENLGMGWVSLFEPAALGQLLQLPAGAQAIAVLCLGPVPAFYPKPMLELQDWRQGRSLQDMVATDQWPAVLPC